jgi:hypothetical protein
MSSALLFARTVGDNSQSDDATDIMAVQLSLHFYDQLQVKAFDPELALAAVGQMEDYVQSNATI